ncbi:caspase-2-like isoform X3 [Phyllostomus discolor]|uniref:Caspase-2-like isoform X3 n=1 Tax=Phyllostomus discolor TaxID=89673 RepID=A0A7E6D973_9CHIR|nr:caspase-2-like isoform X3 [Phyllostomus discolor]
MSVPARKQTAAPKEQSKEWGSGPKVPRKGAESGSAHMQLIGQKSGRRQGLGSKAPGELCAQTKHLLATMAFLVSGTLQVAAQVADAQDSLGRKGKYSVQGPRVALTLSSPEVSASTVSFLEGVFQTLGFESCWRREALVQDFLEELTGFRKQLVAHGAPVGCVLVALVAPSGQLRQPQKLVWELSGCGALRGCPKVFLLLSSAPRAAPEPGAFLTSLRELCGRCPHWSLLQLLTEVFCRTAEESSGVIYCPVLRSSLRGALCLGKAEPWRPEAEPSPSAQYDQSGDRAALLLAVIRDRPGAQHDVDALGGLCRALGFETTLRIDPTAQAFQEELAQFQERLDTCRSPVSCALVALMAHGGPQGQLLGADGQEVQPEAFVQELSRCRALRGCPKIFLIQACRGSSSSRGRTPGSRDQADILTVYAAAEGCVAYRDEKGSDFIQTLVEVLRAAPEGDLLELLTEVNRQVCELDVLGPDCNEHRKACLEIRSSLRHRLCLQLPSRC